jgi:Heterokaryon incompatibility protein (HET)
MVTKGGCSTSLVRYKYSPLLTTSSFRILELLPGYSDDNLHIRLQPADWDEPPTYEAISYAWADTNIRVQIICESLMLDITPNLRDALRQMRLKDRPRYLWAEAICINQEDVSERGHQVSNMLKIYQNAALVLAWLGIDQDEQAEKASKIINYLTEAICLRVGTSVQDLKNVNNFATLISEKLRDLIPHDVDILSSHHWYYSKEWFHRLWVYQEVNSGTEVIGMCGSAHLSWDAVAFVATLFAYREQPIPLLNILSFLFHRPGE